MGFCTKCGSPLDENVKFCTSCGARIERDPITVDEANSPDESPTVDTEASANAKADSQAAVQHDPACDEETTTPPDITAQPASEQEQAPSSTAAPDRRSPLKNKQVVAIGIAACAVVAFIGGFFLLKPQSQNSAYPNSANDAPAQDVPAGDAKAQDKAEKTEEGARQHKGVKLNHEYTTSPLDAFEGTGFSRYRFKYPDGWEITDHRCDEYDEIVTLSDEQGNEIVFSQGNETSSYYMLTSAESIEKLCDTDFEISVVDSFENETFVIGDVLCKTKSPEDEIREIAHYYALIPQTAFEDRSVLEMSMQYPRFNDRASVLVTSFNCKVPEDGFTPDKEQEILAILSSLEIVEAAPKEEISEILPNSSEYEFTVSQLEALNDLDLYIARNEIYARHGRKFQNEDLRNHFEGLSWYTPSIEPEDFTDSMLNDVEKHNLAVIRSIEESRNSEYL